MSGKGARFGILLVVLACLTLSGCGQCDSVEEPASHPGSDYSSEWELTLDQKLAENIRWDLKAKTADKNEMIRVPGGKAMLGCEETFSEVRVCLPKKVRKIDAFYIDQYEVTNTDYDRCVAEHQCLPITENNPHIPDALKPNYPAIATYEKALRYCLWAGKRLPTEYEWEKAARGTDGQIYPWGNEPPTGAWANICGAECTMDWADPEWTDGYAYTAPAGQFPQDRSPYGLMDTAGNVKEWVTTTRRLPSGHYLACGGSWYSDHINLQVFVRQIWHYGIRLDDKGFRCALDD